MIELEDLSEAAAVLDVQGEVLSCNAVWRERFSTANVLRQLSGGIERRDFRTQLRLLFKGFEQECGGHFAWSPGRWVRARARRLLHSESRYLLRIDETTGESRHRQMQSLVDQSLEAVFLLDPADGRVVYANPALLELMEVQERLAELTALQFGPMFRPEALPQMCRRLSLTGPLILKRDQKTATGMVFPAQMQVMLLEGGGATVLACVLHDLSESRRQLSRLRASGSRLQAILEASPVAIVTYTAEGLVASWSPAATSIYGWKAEEVVHRPSPFGDELTHELILDIMADGATVALPLTRRCKDGREVHISLSICPLLDEDGLLSGLLELGENITDRVHADRLATNLRLLENREAERLSLAREIHDGPMQELLLVGFSLANLEDVAGVPRLQPIQASLVQVSRHLRSVVNRLRPAGLEELGLADSLHQVVRQITRDHPSPPALRLHFDDIRGLAASQELCLFRMVQEAFQNALRHAQASNVEISLRRAETSVELLIADDGRGFEPPARLREFGRAEHYGLLGMEERAQLCGGVMKLHSAPAQGTRIQVSLPLESGQK